MASGTLTTNTNTNWYIVNDNAGVHIGGTGTFGSGTITVQQRIESSPVSAKDDAGSAITYTAAFDNVFDFRSGDVIRLNLAGATSPDIDWIINGSVEKTT